MARSTNEITIDPPYQEALEGILSFKTLEDAERTLERLEALRQMYSARGDDKGSEYCRRIALTGRRRAESISRNRRVREPTRQQKKEIALWFQVWLETPHLFVDWIALRKGTASYARLADAEGGVGSVGRSQQSDKED